MTGELSEDFLEEELLTPVKDEHEARVRFTRLKLMALSPAHYLAGAGGDPTTAREKGSAVHSMLLRGARVTFYPEKTKAGRSAPRNGAKWEAFKADNSGALIVSASEYEACNRMADSVRANRQAMEVLGGVQEDTILFDWLGIECRSTPDVRARGGEFVTELKTTVSSNPWRFAWQAKKLGYHGQMAFHRVAMKKAKHGDDPLGFVVAVESSEPYPTTVFRLTPKAWEQGDKQIRIWMEQLKTCLNSNQWPPYALDVVDLDVPDDDTGLLGETFTAESLPQGW